jgi:hypothetical protein
MHQGGTAQVPSGLGVATLQLRRILAPMVIGPCRATVPSRADPSAGWMGRTYGGAWTDFRP